MVEAHFAVNKNESENSRTTQGYGSTMLLGTEIGDDVLAPILAYLGRGNKV